MEPKQPLSEVLSSNTSIIDRFREHPFAALETYKFFNQTEATLREYSDAVIDGDEDMLLTEEERVREHLLERSAKFHPTRISHRQLAQAAFEQRSQEIK